MKVIILGGGMGFPGLLEKNKQPTALHEVFGGVKVLDLLLKNLQISKHNDVVFVGGYKIKKIVKAFPDIKYYYNHNWKHTGATYSLHLAANEIEGDVLICYADVLFSSELLENFLAADQSETSIKIAEDQNWKERFAGRGKKLLKESEKIISQNGEVIKVGKRNIKVKEATGQFAGLIHLSEKSASVFQMALNAFSEQEDIFKKAGLDQFLNYLATNKYPVCSESIAGKWAELDAPQDVAQFAFGTKAETLLRLQQKIKLAKIEDQVTLSLKEWNSNPEACVDRVVSKFKSTIVVVRSSAVGEDSFESSNAGEFLSLLHINTGNRKELKESIQSVFNSYPDDNLKHQCLIQPQIMDVRLSGVAFSRDLETKAPYITINYDESGKTDVITSGAAIPLKTFIYYKDSKEKLPDPSLRQLIDSIHEIEALVGYDSLDVEFAFSKNFLHILQVRPIVANRKAKFYSDEDFKAEIKSAKAYIERALMKNQLLGVEGNVLANMPDWNPAEIVGKHPRTLAMSLYQYLITDEIWRQQRCDFGYRDSFPCPLVLTICGQPYIDTKASFNSFIPSSLEEATAKKLLIHYINRLRKKPELHDKVEFDIAFTCFSFDLLERLQFLKEDGFSSEEVENIFSSLLNQTLHLTDPVNNIVEGAFQEIDKLKQSFDRKIQQKLSPEDIVFEIHKLLEDCKKWGTLPFAKLARCGFIASDFLKSFVRLKVITNEEYSDFLNSFDTVAGQLQDELHLLYESDFKRQEFLDRYGHLRPGTYDITSPRYDEATDYYFEVTPPTKATEHRINFSFRKESLKAINELLKEYNFNLNADQLIQFIIKSIQGREYSKFIFTKNLSDALVLIGSLGKKMGFSKEDLSHLPIDKILELRKQSFPSDTRSEFKRIIKRNRAIYNFHRSIKLPHLIDKPEKLSYFYLEEGKPNFITHKKVVEEIVNLIDDSNNDINGKIVLIENADPGYDWIFSHQIKGLITLYGGANSHMAIRAAEFGLPAAIGCGEKIGNQLKNAKVVELNSEIQQIKIISSARERVDR